MFFVSEVAADADANKRLAEAKTNSRIFALETLTLTMVISGSN